MNNGIDRKETAIGVVCMCIYMMGAPGMVVYGIGFVWYALLYSAEHWGSLGETPIEEFVGFLFTGLMWPIYFFYNIGCYLFD